MTEVMDWKTAKKRRQGWQSLFDFCAGSRQTTTNDDNRLDCTGGGLYESRVEALSKARVRPFPARGGARSSSCPARFSASTQAMNESKCASNPSAPYKASRSRIMLLMPDKRRASSRLT